MTLPALFTRKGRLRLARYRQILSTLVAYGFGEVVHRTGLGKVFHLLRRPFRRTRPDRVRAPGVAGTWERIRLVVEDLGPTFIKLGQILSNRPDLIPRQLQSELEKLQKSVPPFASRQAVQLLQDELGAPIDSLFRDFDHQPLAAASIAQIHRAVLPNGASVAVKIQRPGLQELVEVDIAILAELAQLIARYVPESRELDLPGIVEEFEKGMRQELDFLREAAAIERFAAQFADEPGIKVPRVYRKLCSRRVMTMEFIEGRPLGDFLSGEQLSSQERSRIAQLGAELTLKQVFVHGFFHADPHPGNIVLLDDGRICYLDFGLTGSLVRRDLEVVSDILMSIIASNEQKAARAVVRFAGSRDFDTARSIERDISELIERFQSSQAGDFSFTMLLVELIEVLMGKGLALPADLFLLVKALITIEGVATALDPEFDFAAQLVPFAGELVRHRYDPQRLASTVAATAVDYAELAQSFPGDYYKLVDTIANAQVRVRLDEDSIAPIRSIVLQASSALVFALVLGSLIIGSAVIVHSRVPPLWNGVPVIGIAGFVVAGIVGFWLLLKIIRSGGM